MSKIVIAGAGIVGLGTALLLVRDGHDVTVLERDADGPPREPEESWTRWTRRGVNQFRLPHFLLARYRALIETELPEVQRVLLRAGAVRFNPVLALPERLRGPAREEDSDFECISGRRPVVEAAVVSVADGAAHLAIRRGVTVEGLVLGPSAHKHVPNVVGVRLDSGEEIDGDLFLDMTGRRSPLPRWLGEIGARPLHEELDDCGFIYYGRHFRSTDGHLPVARGGLLMHLGTVSSVTLPADNGTWSVALVASAKDKALYRLRDAAVWERVLRSLPPVAHWLEGEAIDDQVMTVTKIEDRYRSLVVDGAPVATGVVAVGDAWACSNPTVGRGISIGMMQAVLFRDVIAERGLDDPWEFACSFHRATAEVIEPWYRETLAADRHRLAEIDALVRGDEYHPDDAHWELGQTLAMAARRDPDCLRAFTSLAMALKRRTEVIAEPGLLDQATACGADWRQHPFPAPSRDALLSIVAGW